MFKNLTEVIDYDTTDCLQNIEASGHTLESASKETDNEDLADWVWSVNMNNRIKEKISRVAVKDWDDDERYQLCFIVTHWFND